MPIPQSSLSNNLSGLAASVDSSSEALSILQIIDKSIAFGNYKKFYDSAGSLPLADSAMEGSIAVVDTSSYNEYSGALYGCNGTDWNVIKFLDPAPKNNTPYAGSDYGFTAGGLVTNDLNFSPYSYSDYRSRYAFNVDTSISDFGNLTTWKYTNMAGWSTSTHGYQAGGAEVDAVVDPVNTVTTSVVDKFPFSTSGTSVAVSNLTGTPTAFGLNFSTRSIHSTSHGYAWNVGGQILHKYQFSAESPVAITGIDIGPSTVFDKSMHSDNDGYGYTSGGVTPPATPPTAPLYGSNLKWSYSSDTATGDIGSQAVNKYRQQSTSSPTDGYCHFGTTPPLGVQETDTVEKFPFASLNGISLPATAPYGARESQTWSAIDAGYVVGGYSTRNPVEQPPTYNQPFSRIVKLPYSNETAYVTQLASLTSSNPNGPITGLIRGTGHQV